MAPKKKDTKAAVAEAAAAEAAAAEEKKRKAADAEVAEAPAKKEAKVEAHGSIGAAVVEQEKDDADKRPSMTDAVAFDPSGMTLNVLPMCGGRVLTALSEGAMGFLVAGARANVGVKAGRYLFEAKIVEYVSMPLGVVKVKVGFSTNDSSLVLGDDDNGVSFDAEGFFMAGAKRCPQAYKAHRFQRDDVLAVLLNLDPKSPNANTVSLFKDGVRVHQPQKLPEGLVGKALFPHVTFRGVSLQVSFGPEPFAPLPFKCRCIQAAPKDDVLMQKQSAPAKGSKYEVVFPVGLPNEGLFDWLDEFLIENPGYYELSDRKIGEWARKSGLWQGNRNSWNSSNDKPDLNFGVTSFDDLSVQRVLASVSALVPRNYVVAELKSNLLPSERAQSLKLFCYPHYKKVARVVMGEPPAPYKKKVQEVLLKQKQDKANMEYKAKLAERERKRKLKEMKKAQAELTKKRLEEAKAKAKELADKKAAKEAGEKKEEEKKAEAVEEKKEEVKDDAKEEEKKDEKGTAEEKKEDDHKEEEEEEPELEEPVAELSEEEKNIWHRTHATPDVTQSALASSFLKFALPVASEGFDDIKYEWSKGGACETYMKTWLVKNKTTVRLENLKPSNAFKEQAASMQKKLAEFQQALAAFKAKPSSKVQKKPDEGDDDEVEADIYSVSNLCDVGDGEPLFVHFHAEDWALVTIRSEIVALLRSFKQDTEDPEHPGMHESHLSYYYQKYFHKSLSHKMLGVPNNEGLVELIKDVVSIDKASGVLAVEFAEDSVLEHCVRLAEENRRGRQRRIDAGDETAKLHLNLNAATQKPVATRGAKVWTATNQGKGKSWGKGKGGW